MKKIILISAIAVLFILLISTILLVDYFRCPKVDFDIAVFTDCNYNNYNIQWNTIDYRYGRFAWVDNSFMGSVIAVQSSDGDTSYIRGYRDIEQIQLTEEGIYFLSDLRLYLKAYTEASSVELIAEEVASFIVTEEYVFYEIHVVDTPSAVKPSGHVNLMCINKKTKETTLFSEDVNFYCIDNNGLYVKTTYSESDVTVYTAEGSYSKVRLKGAAYISVQCGGDFLAYYNDTALRFIKDGMEDFDTILLGEAGVKYADVAGICENELFYVSYRGKQTPETKSEEIASASNGLWKIDPKAGTKELLSHSTYDELYSFGSYGLFGVKDGKIYKISAEDGSAIKIS